MAAIEDVSNASFESEVLKSDNPVLVDFWAPWCGPCRMQSPIIEKLSSEFDGKVKFVKLNTDDNQETAMDYGITGIPTLILFKGGEAAKKLVGLHTEAQLKQELETVV